MGNPNRKASPGLRKLLGINLRRLRKTRGYTQQELADLCGFSNSYVSSIERGRVNISLANLEALTRGLMCSAIDLLSDPPNR